MDPEIICGIELEMEYNDGIICIEKGGYHDLHPTWFSDCFIAENDGSLETTGWDDNVELVSVPFLLKDYKSVLDNFKESIYHMVATSKGIPIAMAEDTYGLNDLICFNNTTGAHIHLSLIDKELNPLRSPPQVGILFRNKVIPFEGKKIPIRSVSTFDFLKPFTDRLKEKVEEKLPSIYPQWQMDLYREFARPIETHSDIDIFGGGTHHSRRMEWNLTEDEEQMEYRSFHLRGVRSWDDFYKIWSCVFGLIEKTFKGEFRKAKPFYGLDREFQIPQELSEPIVQETIMDLMEQRNFCLDIMMGQTDQRHRLVTTIKNGNNKVKFKELIKNKIEVR